MFANAKECNCITLDSSIQFSILLCCNHCPIISLEIIQFTYKHSDSGWFKKPIQCMYSVLKLKCLSGWFERLVNTMVREHENIIWSRWSHECGGIFPQGIKHQPDMMKREEKGSPTPTDRIHVPPTCFSFLHNTSAYICRRLQCASKCSVEISG